MYPIWAIKLSSFFNYNHIAGKVKVIFKFCCFKGRLILTGKTRPTVISDDLHN